MELIDISELTVLEEGTLKSNGAPYAVVFLEPCHVRQIKALHDIVYDSPENRQNKFILQRDEGYFLDALTGHNGNAVIGIVSRGQLIAKSAIFHPTKEDPSAAEAMADTVINAPPEQTSVLQAVTVSPDCRGNGLMQTMLRHWYQHARAHDRCHVLSEIEIHNQPSLSAFLKAGLHIAGIHTSHVDGARVTHAHARIKYAAHAHLDDNFNAQACGEAAYIPCLADDLDAQRRLLEEGYVGVSLEEEGQVLIMKKAPGAAAPPTVQ